MTTGTFSGIARFLDGDPRRASGIPAWHNGLVPVVMLWLLGAGFLVAYLAATPPQSRLGAGFFALGFSLNTLAIVVNGTMPFSKTSARQAGIPMSAVGAPARGHGQITADTFLPAITNVIPVPGAGVVGMALPA